MKALVAGGGGFIGSRLVRSLLNKNWFVRVLDVRYGELVDCKDKLKFFGVGSDDLRGGIVDKNIVEQAIKGVDVVYHLALNWDGATWKHKTPLPDLFYVNIKGTLNLLEEAKSEGIKHFLFASSTAVYGNGSAEIVDEESLCKPELFRGDPGPAYGIVKFVTERLCLLYFSEYELPVTILRIGYVFEPPSKGEIHVKDVVQAFILATLNSKAYGQVFNVACEPSVSTRKIRKVLKWEPKFTKSLKVQPDKLY
ncbi:MAG: NAD(P)-dependent oxidoreductase [Candidatus Bathyarchaeia archaeon]